MASVEDLVQELGLAGALLLDGVVAEVVDDEEVRPSVDLQALGEGVVGQRGDEVGEEVGAGGVPDAMVGGACANREGLRDMAVPDAVLPEQQEVLSALDPVECSEGHHEVSVQPRLEVEVERLESGMVGEFGLFDAAMDAAFRPPVRLGGKDPRGTSGSSSWGRSAWSWS